MIRKLHLTFIVSTLFMVSMVFAAPSFSPEAIKIGLTVSMSGKYKEAGLQQLQGIQMWRDDVNERGALLGKRIELLVKDDHSRSEDVAVLYEQFIRQEKVDLLLGPYSSDLTIAAGNIAEQYHFPLLAIAASASSIWKDKITPYVFGIYAQSDRLMNSVIQQAVENGLQRVAIIYADAEYTRSIAKGSRMTAEGRGLEIVAYEMFNHENDSLATSVNRIAETKPELIIASAYLEDSIDIVKALKLKQVDHKMLVFSGSADTEEFEHALGDDVEGVTSAIQWSESQHLPGAYDFSFRYEQKYGEEPSYQAAGGYAAGQILEAAVRLSGSLSREHLRLELLKLKFRSLFGHYRVGENGQQIGKQAYVMQWQDGERRMVMPKALSSHVIRYYDEQ